MLVSLQVEGDQLVELLPLIERSPQAVLGYAAALVGILMTVRSRCEPSAGQEKTLLCHCVHSLKTMARIATLGTRRP